jgi:hypothetical protein
VTHRVTIGALRALQRMAVEGVTMSSAARRTGENAAFVVYWARGHRVPFQPRQNRGLPAWLMPEAARQAERALRASMQRVGRFLGRPMP